MGFLDLTSIVPIDELASGLIGSLSEDIEERLGNLKELEKKAEELRKTSKETRNESIKQYKEQLAEEIDQEIEETKEALKKQLQDAKDSAKEMINSKIEELEEYGEDLKSSIELIGTSLTNWDIRLGTIPVTIASVIAAIDPGSKAGVLTTLPPAITDITQSITELSNVLKSTNKTVSKLKEGTEFIVGLLSSVPSTSAIGATVNATVGVSISLYESTVGKISSFLGQVESVEETASDTAEEAQKEAEKAKYKAILEEYKNSTSFTSDEISKIKEAFKYSAENKLNWDTEYSDLHDKIYN